MELNYHWHPSPTYMADNDDMWLSGKRNIKRQSKLHSKTFFGGQNMESNKSEVKVREVCQNCGSYNRCTKKCADGKYVPRKHSCEKFNEKKN